MQGVPSRPKYKIAYQERQRDPRVPLWCQLTFSVMCFLIATFGVIASYGAVYEYDKCELTSSYINANRYIGWVALAISIIMMVFALYLLIRWRWVWMTTVTVPAPIKVYGEDIEDIEPGFLTVSSAKSFLSTQNATSKIKLEAERAMNDLELTKS